MNYPSGLRLLDVVRQIPKREQILNRNNRVREVIWEIRAAIRTLREAEDALAQARGIPLVPTYIDVVEVFPGDDGYEKSRNPGLFYYRSPSLERDGSAWSSLVNETK